MADSRNPSKVTAKRPSENELTVPLVFLTSTGAGWEDVGLTVEAFHEPTTLKGWIDPVIPETSLMLLTQGTMLIEQALANSTQQRWTYQRGDIFLKPGGSITRELHWSTLSPEPMQTLHIHLSQHLLTSMTEALTDRDTSGLSLVRQAGFQDGLVTQIGLSLLAELTCLSAGSKLYAQSAAQMLAVHLLRHYASEKIDIKTPQGRLSGQQVNLIAEFVWANIDQALSLDELAQQVGFSPYHFARVFRESTGHSPHQFVLRQRIEYAKRLVKKRDIPLTQVALDSGFANQSHLTQMFKRFLGITPKSYRDMA